MVHQVRNVPITGHYLYSFMVIYSLKIILRHKLPITAASF